MSAETGGIPFHRKNPTQVAGELGLSPAKPYPAEAVAILANPNIDSIAIGITQHLNRQTELDQRIDELEIWNLFSTFRWLANGQGEVQAILQEAQVADHLRTEFGDPLSPEAINVYLALLGFLLSSQADYRQKVENDFVIKLESFYQLVSEIVACLQQQLLRLATQQTRGVKIADTIDLQVGDNPLLDEGGQAGSRRVIKLNSQLDPEIKKYQLALNYWQGVGSHLQKMLTETAQSTEVIEKLDTSADYSRIGEWSVQAAA
jgi:hypothetical protein